MGKRAIITLVIVAIIIAGAPPLFGIAYESQIHEQVASAPQNAYVVFELADYERGLYTSHGTLRFALSDEYIEQIRATLESGDTANPRTTEQQETLDSLLEFLSAELLFDIDVQHGPVTTGDGVHVGLATVHSEMDSTSGRLAEIQQQLDIPYLLQVDAQVDFDGSADFQAVIPPFATRDDDYSMEFSGLDYSGRFDRPDTSIKAQGGTEQFLFESEDAQISVTDLSLTADNRMLSTSLWLGQTSFDIAELRFTDAGRTATPVALHGLGFDADVSVNDAADKLAIAVMYRAADITGVPDNELADVKVGMRFRNIDRAAIEDYVELVQQTGFSDPDAMQKMMPELQSIGAKVLRSSPGVDLSPFEFVLNGEPFAANIGIDFDGAGLPADIDIMSLTGNPAILIEALSAEGQVESSESLAKAIAINVLRGQIAEGVPPESEFTAEDIDAAAKQQATMMLDGSIQQGLILRKDGRLKVDISYADGQLFINDVPIPLG